MGTNLLLSLLDEAKCLEVFRLIRWPEGVSCVHCQARDFWIDRQEHPKLQYRCRHCGGWWTDLSGTIFAGTRLTIAQWMLAMEWSHQGKSALEIAADLGVHRHTVGRMCKRLRQDPMAVLLSSRLASGCPIGQVDRTAVAHSY